MLSIRYEKRLADLAQTKYQIPPVRAHQLIQKAAEQHGIGIISHSDAQQFVQNLVEDSVGNRSSLPANEIEKLAIVGEKWGISKDATFRQIRTLTAQNRIQRKIAATKRFAFYGICLATILAATWSLRQIEWSGIFSTNNNEQNATPVVDEELAYPDWWPESMVQESHRFNRKLQRQLNSMLESGAGNSATSEFYSKVVVDAVNRQNRSALDSFIATTFYRHPDSDPAIAIIDQLVGIFNLLDRNRVLSPGNIRRSKRAAQLISDIRFYNDESEKGSRRSQLVAERINALVENETNAEDRDALKNVLTDSLSIQLWSESMQTSKSNPKSTAACLAELENFSSTESAEINELRLRTCKGIIYSAPVQWTAIRSSIQKSIEQSSRTNIRSWVTMALDPILPFDLRHFLASSLASKLKLNAAGDNAMFVGLEKHLRNTSFENIESEMQCCQFLHAEIQKLNSRLRISGISNFDENKAKVPNEQVPELIQATAELNNHLLSWIEKQATPKTLSNSPKHSEKLSSSNFPPRLQPTPSQRRQFKESIERLKTEGPNLASTRIRAISRLRELSTTFRSIEQDEAIIVSTYILGPRIPQEQLAIERAMPDFKHWVRLKLAIADQFHKSSISQDDLSEYLNRLDINTANEGPTIDNLQKSVRLAILQDCQELLQNKEATKPESLMWAAFDKYYSSTFAHRLQIINSDNPTGPHDQMLASALTKQSPWLQQHIELLKSQNSRLDRWILSNLLIAGMISEQHDVSWPSKFVPSGSTGRDLLSSELSLFRVIRPVFLQRFKLIAGGA